MPFQSEWKVLLKILVNLFANLMATIYSGNQTCDKNHKIKLVSQKISAHAFYLHAVELVEFILFFFVFWMVVSIFSHSLYHHVTSTLNGKTSSVIIIIINKINMTSIHFKYSAPWYSVVRRSFNYSTVFSFAKFFFHFDFISFCLIGISKCRKVNYAVIINLTFQRLQLENFWKQLPFCCVCLQRQKLKCLMPKGKFIQFFFFILASPLQSRHFSSLTFLCEILQKT